MTDDARRIIWIDVLKGVSILWIVYFHLFRAMSNGAAVDPLPADFLGRLSERCAANGEVGVAIGCWARGLAAAVTLLGFHAVNVFLVLAGFGLAHALGDMPSPRAGWRSWYRRRLLRLYPLYWVAHFVILFSPFVALPEPFDYRFWLSLTGFRLWPIDMIHTYFNPSFWYFTCLVELYLAFPVLWWLCHRLHPAAFAALGVAVAATSRWCMIAVWPVEANWLQGACFLARIAEFTLGMALGVWHRRDASGMERILFRPVVVAAGIVLWGVGIMSYRASWSYCFTEALLGYGVFAVTANAAVLLARRPRLSAPLAMAGAYSYGLYLFHQPYVIYAGERMRSLSTLPYFALATLLVASLFLASRWIEIAVGRITERALSSRINHA